WSGRGLLLWPRAGRRSLRPLGETALRHGRHPGKRGRGRARGFPDAVSPTPAAAPPPRPAGEGPRRSHRSSGQFPRFPAGAGRAPRNGRKSNRTGDIPESVRGKAPNREADGHGTVRLGKQSGEIQPLVGPGSVSGGASPLGSVGSS